MKKMLLGSIFLLIFSLSISIIQISCSKTQAQLPSQSPPLSSLQQNGTQNAQAGKIIYTKDLTTSSDKEIWTADYDGSNAVQIPMTYPAGITWCQSDEHAGLSISPDGLSIFMVLQPVVNGGAGQVYELYSLPITGGTPALIVPGRTGRVVAY